MEAVFLAETVDILEDVHLNAFHFRDGDFSHASFQKNLLWSRLCCSRLSSGGGVM